MTELAYTTHGDRAKPSLLMLHGFMSSRHQWLGNIEGLVKNFHLVLVELWGHGESPEPEAPDAWTVDAYIAQFEALRGRLEIDKWGLVGQSYGAGIILNYALRFPSCTPAVVVTNSRSAFGTVDQERRKPEGGNPAKSPRDIPLHPVNAKRFPEEVKAALVRDADAMTLSAIASTGNLATELNFTSRLGELQQPVLLTNGRFERPFQEDVARLRRLYPSIAIVDLDGGHSVNVEAIEGFDQAVTDFFCVHLG